jgi:hypothetical protein
MSDHDPAYDTQTALSDMRRVADALASWENDDEAQGMAADLLAAANWFDVDAPPDADREDERP